MNEKIKEALPKKFLSLTKLILGFVVICMLLVFDNLDYRELRDKSAHIGVLMKLSRMQPEQLEIADKEHAVAGWLDTTHKSVATSYLSTRKAIAGLLIKMGVREEVVRRAKGYDSDEKNKFNALYVVRQDTVLPPVDESFMTEPSVEEMMRTFRYYAQSLELNILAAADTALLRKKMNVVVYQESDPEEYEEETSSPEEDSIAQLRFFRETYLFKAVVPLKDSIRLVFYEDIGAGQRNPNDQYITTAGTFVKIKAPAILFFSGFDTALVNELYNDKDLQESIVAEYGKMSIDDMSTLFDKALEKNVNAVSILGIDISRRWFPLAILFLLAIVNYLLLVNVGKAKSNGVKPFGSYPYDDILDWTVNNSYMRAVLWAGAPLVLTAAIFLTSFIHYSPAYYFIAAVMTLTAFFLGLSAYRRSRGL